MTRRPLAFLMLTLILNPQALGEPANKEMLRGLAPLAGLVGIWKGTGTSQTSSGWKETIECGWGFREKDGRVALEWRIAGGEMLEAAVLTFDPEKKVYRFAGRRKDRQVLRFEGKPAGAQSLRLFRIDENSRDGLDRLDVKLVREGDKLVYLFAKKVGRSAFEGGPQVELFREGPPLADLQKGPRCVVTGGAGVLEFEHAGKMVHVACEGAKAEFLAHPDRYLLKEK